MITAFAPFSHRPATQSPARTSQDEANRAAQDEYFTSVDYVADQMSILARSEPAAAERFVRQWLTENRYRGVDMLASIDRALLDDAAAFCSR